MSAKDGTSDAGASAPSSNKPWMIRTGRVLSALPILGLTFSAVMKLSHQPPVVEGFAHFGYPPSALTTIGVVELVCVLLYAVPQTAVLGAVLLTAYLGGAVATHVRLGEPFIAVVVLGIFVWAGLFLRDERIRALLPLRR